jgi:uncharacterized Zn finger protein
MSEDDISCPSCGPGAHISGDSSEFERVITNEVDNEVIIQQWVPKRCLDCGYEFAILGDKRKEGT